MTGCKAIFAVALLAVTQVVAARAGPATVQAFEPEASASAAIEADRNPFTRAIVQRIQDNPGGETAEDRAEDAALLDFYQSRNGEPVWLEDGQISKRGQALLREIENGAAWGLEAAAFKAPTPAGNVRAVAEDARAELDLQISHAALLYARHARGGRIINPSELLNSHLNRMPQLLPPDEVLAKLAESEHPDQTLTRFHPHHTQFQRLRQAYLSVRNDRKHLLLQPGQTLEAGDESTLVPALRHRFGLRKPTAQETPETRFDDRLAEAVRQFQIENGLDPADGVLTSKTVALLNRKAKAAPEKLLANMEAWRWMWDDLGDLHIMANVPDYMLNVVKYGDVIFRERVVVGQIDKQTSIFTRTLKHIVLRPMWRVPESIKVRELWPSLKRGGGLMREHNLIVETKDGRTLDWRKIDWYKADIRDYEVVQRPSRHGAMGLVKFSFPSQHTIFIHDTPDKYMFKYKRRTLSHGCLRLRNPVRMAKLLLAESEGMTAEDVDGLIENGTNRNAIKITRRIPVHLVYFTAWVEDDGKLRTFSDIYGHEKRIRLALAGKWKQIYKGRDHLAPPQPIAVSSKPSERRRARAQSTRDHIQSALGGGFF